MFIKCYIKNILGLMGLETTGWDRAVGSSWAMERGKVKSAVEFYYGRSCMLGSRKGAEILHLGRSRKKMKLSSRHAL